MALSATQMYTEILRRDFNAFIHRSFLELNGQAHFLPNWHLEVLAAKLEDVRQGRCRRLIINLPPRHLKSHTATIAFPAWLLGHEPSKRILAVSYAQELSDKFARDSRNLMTSPFYQALFATRLSSDRQSIADFETTEGGYRLSSSVQGGITGRGADIIIVDDPMKADDALSDTRRNSLNEWYDNTLRSRLNSQATGAIILVMQRLRADDLVKHLRDTENWEVLSFPLVAIDDADYDLMTPFGRRKIHRREGDVLQPALFPPDKIESLRDSMTAYHFSAQYQQNPTPREGNMIKTEWLKFYEPGSEPDLANFDRIVQSWDTANMAGDMNDFSVCTTWGIKGECYFLLDVFRKKLLFPQLKKAVEDLERRFPQPIVVIEDNASGTQLIQVLKQEARFRVRAYSPPAGADKEIRVDAQSIHFESGRVLLRKPASWLNDYVAELTGFPNTKYDDQVDSTTQALSFMSTDLRTLYYRHAVEKRQQQLRGPGSRIRVRPPATLKLTDTYQTISGKLVQVAPDGSVEVDESDAIILLKKGWTKVEDES
jgi:predicted phage terminase large subunit-like protein